MIHRRRKCGQSFSLEPLDPRVLLSATPTLSISAPATRASENGAVRAFNISRTGSTNTPLIVHFIAGGRATNGVDYGIIGAAATIRAGQNSMLINVRPFDDLRVESVETVTLTLMPDAGYQLASAPAATIRLTDNDGPHAPPPPPVVQISSPSEPALEGADTYRAFTITRGGPLTTPLVVHLSVSGSATNNIDYGIIGSATKMPAGQASRQIQVRTVNDNQIESDESVTVTLQSNDRYTLGDNASATILILDSGKTTPPPPAPLPPDVSVTSSGGTTESNSPPASFQITRTGDTAKPLQVNFTFPSRGATPGTDYESIPDRITIPAGQSSATIPVKIIVDDVPEDHEWIELRVSPSPDYTSIHSSASIDIAANDLQPLTANWSALPALTPGRSQGMGAVVGGKLYVFGGYTDDSGISANRADVYNPADQTWTRIADLPVGLADAACAADDRYVYLAGGYPSNADRTAQLPATDVVHRYDTTTNAWSTVQSLPEPRAAGALVFLEASMHYIGGVDVNGVDRGEHWSIVPTDPNDVWRSQLPLPTPRHDLAAAVTDHTIFAIGGQHLQDGKELPLATVETWGPYNHAWEIAPSLPTPQAMIPSAVTINDGKIFVAGAPNGGSTDQISVFWLDQWTEVTPLPANRLEGILAAINDQLIFTTGYFNAFSGATWTANFS